MKTKLMMLVVCGLTASAFGFFDTFSYSDLAAAQQNWGGIYQLVQDPQQGDGNMARVIANNEPNNVAGSLIGKQTAPATDWYISVNGPAALGNYQGFGIFNADHTKQVSLMFDQGAPLPVRVQLNTGTWALNYWETWYGSGDPSALVTGIGGLWHFHSDAAGTKIEKDGQVVFSREGYSFINDNAMHFEFGTNYGGSPVDFNWVGTVPEPATVSLVVLGILGLVSRRNRK